MKNFYPIDRYFKRMREELPPLEKAVSDKKVEIIAELERERKLCGTETNPHIDNGHVLEGACVKCGKLLG